MVRHIENAPHVGGLSAIEELIGLGGIGVEIAAAGEEAERHEGVEEVAGGARAETQATAEGIEGLRPPGPLAEHPQLHGAEQGLGGPEAEARLQDALGGVGLGHFLRIGSTSFG